MIALLAVLALSCGVDAWEVKVLRDSGAAKALAPAPRPSTIAALGALPRDTPRRSYVVTGVITLIKLEADSDYHLVLADTAGHQMIVEAPHPDCAKGSLAIGAIRRARRQAAALTVGDKVRATGLLFFDRCHGQAGAAPLCQELHPLLSIVRLP